MAKTWYLCFSKGSGHFPWWQRPFTRFMDKKWGHVMLVAPVAGQTLLLNPNRFGLETSVHYNPPDQTPYDATKAADDLHKAGYTVIQFKHEPEELKFSTVALASCVSLVKTVMGFNSLAVTPRQLMRHVMRRGGVLYKPNSPVVGFKDNILQE